MLVRESPWGRRVVCKKVGCDRDRVDRTESWRKAKGDSVLRWEMGTLFHCNRQWKATGVSVFDDFNFLWEVGGALIG